MMSSFRYTRVRSVADGMSGFVWRVKPGLLFNSKVRLWLEVRGSMLSIFRDEVKDVRVLRKVLDDFSVEGDVDNLMISINKDGQVLQFSCESENEFGEWFLCMRRQQLCQLDISKMPFKRFYIMGKIINESKYSTVSYCQDLTTKQAFVVKTLDRRNKHNRDKVEQELKVMRLPEARSIVRGVDIFEESSIVFIVMEKMGGTLFDALQKCPRGFSQRLAALLFAQILEAIQHLHRHGFVHRDVKLENILCDVPENPRIAKLADFGLSSPYFSENDHKRPVAGAGTLLYTAPEILANGDYTIQADIWSCGVVLYIMHCGQMPFFGNTHKDIVNSIQRGAQFESEIWNHVQPSGVNLVRRMLNPDLKGRPSIDEIFTHPWMLESLQKPRVPKQVTPKHMQCLFGSEL